MKDNFFGHVKYIVPRNILFDLNLHFLIEKKMTFMINFPDHEKKIIPLY